MAGEAFDPKTATVEQVAAYARQVRRARTGALAGGLLAGAVGFWIALHYGPDWMGIIVIVLAFAGVYRIVYELLKPAGATIRTD